jgi:hypothetical protein
VISVSDDVYVIDKFGRKVKLDLVIDEDSKQVQVKLSRRNKTKIPDIKENDIILRRTESN